MLLGGIHMDMVATAEPLLIEGDAYLAIVFTAQVQGPLDILPRFLASDEARTGLVSHINAQKGHFNASKLERHKKMLTGQGIIVDVQFAEAIISFEADASKEHPVHQLYLENLRTRFDSGAIDGLEVVQVDGILFRTGLFSVNLMLRLPGGWQGEKAMHLFGPTGQDKLAASVQAVFRQPLMELSAALATALRKLKNSTKQTLEKWAEAFETADLYIPSIHVVYGGALASCDALNDYLDERYRPLFYMTDASRITSHSPNPHEFVRFGYAFSVVARKERLVERLEEAAFSVRLEHYMYAQLVSLCDFTEQQLSSDEPITADEAKRLRQMITENVNKLRSGAFTFRHELIVFQDRLYEVWFLDRLIARAHDTLQLLVEDRERVEQLRSVRRDRMLGAILVIIALFSLVSVAADAIQLMQYFSQ
jgi:hypothetical protein